MKNKLNLILFLAFCVVVVVPLIYLGCLGPAR